MKCLLYRTWLLISLIVFSFCAVAQNNLPPAYEIKTDTALYQGLDNRYYKLLEDKTGKLTIEQVMQEPVSDNFHYNKSSTTDFDLGIHAYWFRYTLKNTMGHEAKISLGDLGDFNEQSDFYLITAKNKILHKAIGFTVSLNKNKDVKFFNQGPVFPVVLKPGEELTVYNRIYNSYKYFFSPGSFSIGFGNTERLFEQNYSDSQSSYSTAIHDSILFGVLAFAAVVNFLFFLIVRERVYFYFSLYMLDLGLGRIGAEFNFIFFKNLPILSAYIFELVWLFNPFFMTLFIRSLLKTRIYTPGWNTFLAWFSYLYLLSCVPIVIVISENPTPLFLIQTLTTILLYACNLLSFFLLLNKSENKNKILLIAILPAFAVWIVGDSVAILYQRFNLTVFSQAFTIWVHNSWFFIETFCLSWLAVFYSWILLHRFSELRKQIAQHTLEKERERSQLIEQKKIELEKTVEERTLELRNSLDELKSTQAQLIHSEKMASLGELTAGIAHEIQNPLNFVNNFSEINTELIGDMKREIDNGNMEEVHSIANDIEENEQKINYHGKRADGIVKSMLQHSRKSTGQKEPTDINALCDEYLRLSFHGMRARNAQQTANQSFNAEIKTDFDTSIERVNLMPQEIGRVLLNLFNNAFYAVVEKETKADKEYKPTVKVSTKKSDRDILITVADNGNGIPENVVDKIFQPFFTTKPTGEGTGLGLSLSYDIIKTHGGEIKVKTKQREGTEFIVRLPSA